MKESNIPTDRDKFINQLKEIFRLLKERKVLTDRDKANNQQNLFQGGALLAISVIILQGIISSAVSDTPERVSLIALSTAIPLLAGSIAVWWSESHYESFTGLGSMVIGICSTLGSVSAFIGIDAIIWHLSWIAGVIFLCVSAFMFLVYWIYMYHEMKKAQLGNPQFDSRKSLD